MRRLRLTTMLVISGSLLAVLAIGPAEAKKRSCKAKKEQSGCTLPKGATYGGGTDGVFASVVVEKGSFSIGGNARRKCGRSAAAAQSFKGRPKVGKTYKFASTGQQRLGTITLVTTVTGTVKINSAKRATFTGSFSQTRDGATGTGSCGGPLPTSTPRL